MNMNKTDNSKSVSLAGVSLAKKSQLDGDIIPQ
jgi:hypothetical protein